MSNPVTDRITHRMPRPVRCDACGSPRIELQSRGLMGMQVHQGWGLTWRCSEPHCGAMVGCHKGTDIPLGLMADRDTRQARFEAHKVLDPMWRGRHAIATRADVYAWIATFLGIKPELAHISMFNVEQCHRLINGIGHFKVVQEASKGRKMHWRETSRKKRRN